MMEVKRIVSSAAIKCPIIDQPDHYSRRKLTREQFLVTTTTTTTMMMMNRSTAIKSTMDVTTAAEVQAATMALIVDEGTGDGTTTYCLGELQDRKLLVTDDDVTIRSKSEQQKEVVFTKNRWAQFVLLLPDIDEEAKELNKQTRPIAYRRHIGDGYYVSVNAGYMCAHTVGLNHKAKITEIY